MISRTAMRVLAIAAGTLAGIGSPPAVAGEPGGDATAQSLLHDDPQHPWNQLHAALFAPAPQRDRGRLIDNPMHLLLKSDRRSAVAPTYPRASTLLAEILRQPGETHIDDPLRRAVLQHRLWQVFDQLAIYHRAAHRREYLAHNPGLAEFRQQVASAIKRLALRKREIDRLPDNYAQATRTEKFAGTFADPAAAFLPADLLAEDGPWVELQRWRSQPVAPFHVEQRDSGGRAATRVFLRLPQGREATVAYLKRLREFPRPWLPNPQRLAGEVGGTRGDSSRQGMISALMPNPKTPQFSPGTMVGLVQQKLLIDEEGTLRPSPLTQLVEVRVYRKVPAVPEETHDLNHMAFAAGSQSGYRFRLRIAGLLGGDEAGGLVPERARQSGANTKTAERDREPSYNVIHNRCSGCHNPPGVFSLRSQFPFEDIDVQRHALMAAEHPNHEAHRTAAWKREQFAWGLLTADWERGEDDRVTR